MQLTDFFDCLDTQQKHFVRFLAENTDRRADVLEQHIEQISHRLDVFNQQLDKNRPQIIRLDDSRLARALRFLRLTA
jgi:hypothetical protein